MYCDLAKSRLPTSQWFSISVKTHQFRGFRIGSRKTKNTSYFVSNGIEIDGDLSSAAGVAINPGEVFIGQITEINRFGIVALQIENPREGPSKSTIWAYTWEGDHLKRQKLAEYETTGTNALFDKYLAESRACY